MSNRQYQSNYRQGNNQNQGGGGGNFHSQVPLPASQQAAQQQQQLAQQQQIIPNTNLPPPPAAPQPASQQQQQQLQQPSDAENTIMQLVAMVVENRDRQAALAELSKLRDQYPDLAVILWHSIGFVSVLLQEIISAYPLLIPPTAMTTAYSNRVCNSLTLLQGIATHPQTRRAFLQSHLHSFLYPFLNTTSSEKPYEFLRLTSLGVIGALVKADEIEVIQFLLSTDIVPLCLRIMERSTELSRTVATFIMQKILATEIGLNYVCMTPERFVAVAQSLKSEVVEGCTVRLLRHIIRCYLCLTEHPQACKALRTCLPDKLKDGTFKAILDQDLNTKKWLVQLLNALGDAAAAQLLDAPPQQSS